MISTCVINSCLFPVEADWLLPFWENSSGWREAVGWLDNLCYLFIQNTCHRIDIIGAIASLRPLEPVPGISLFWALFVLFLFSIVILFLSGKDTENCYNKFAIAVLGMFLLRSDGTGYSFFVESGMLWTCFICDKIHDLYRSLSLATQANGF